jgi:hypothetical protein
MRPHRQPGDHAERAAAPAAQGPEQVGVLHLVGHHDVAGGEHDLGFQHVARGGPVAPGEVTEAAALREPTCGTHGHAAPALHVAAVRGRRLVDLQPSGPGAHGDRGDARTVRPGRPERVVHGDLAHAVGPDQQRAGRARPAQVVVPGALDHQADAAAGGEFHRGRDIRRRLGRHRARAVPAVVGPEPARGLERPRVVLDRVRVAQAGQRRLGRWAARFGHARPKRRLDVQQPVSGRCLEVSEIHVLQMAGHRSLVNTNSLASGTILA